MEIGGVSGKRRIRQPILVSPADHAGWLRKAHVADRAKAYAPNPSENGECQNRLHVGQRLQAMLLERPRGLTGVGRAEVHVAKPKRGLPRSLNPQLQIM